MSSNPKGVRLAYYQHCPFIIDVPISVRPCLFESDGRAIAIYERLMVKHPEKMAIKKGSKQVIILFRASYLSAGKLAGCGTKKAPFCGTDLF